MYLGTSIQKVSQSNIVNAIFQQCCTVDSKLEQRYMHIQMYTFII